MNIGIDARMYGAQSTTGIGFYIQQLITELGRLNNQHQYYIFLNHEAFATVTLPDQRFKKIKAELPWYSYQEQLKLPRLLNQYQLDLVHFPHFNVPLGYRRPFVVTIHDITPKFFPGPLVKKSPWRKAAYNLVLTHSLKKAKKIITISNHTKQNLIEHCNVEPDNVAVIYLGVGKQYQPITDATALELVRKKFGITKPFLFYVGVWRDHKNLPNLVNAFNLIKSSGRLDIQLLLGGNPDPRYPEIQQVIEQSPYRQDIIQTGFISETDLPVLYSAAKLFVLPSFCEGFGLVAVEAAACGTPVVSSNTTSVPEILGNAGKYFDPKDPQTMAATMVEVLTNDQQYKQMRAEGLTVAKKYRWQDCGQKTLAVYEQVLAN